MKYIKIPKGKKKRISWYKLAKIHNIDINKCQEIYLKKSDYKLHDNRPYVENCKCPYGIRDLENDTCYFGSSIHRCKHFIKYDFDDQGNTYIVCKCNEKYIEGSLF